jgi:hypothetical protein
MDQQLNSSNFDRNRTGTGAMDESQDENEEQQHRTEELEKQSLDWLCERARASGIPDWNQLSKEELVKRLAESSAPAH